MPRSCRRAPGNDRAQDATDIHPLRIVDTHQHLWELDRFSYSWCYTKLGLDRSFTLADYAAATQDINIAKTVHVEADVDKPDIPGETNHVLSIAERGELIAGVAGCAPRG
jgi:predicted TIM-barrel fold metal-dependent hydrolase